jgi:hypothetical protein
MQSCFKSHTYHAESHYGDLWIYSINCPDSLCPPHPSMQPYHFKAGSLKFVLVDRRKAGSYDWRKNSFVPMDRGGIEHIYIFTVIPLWRVTNNKIFVSPFNSISFDCCTRLQLCVKVSKLKTKNYGVQDLQMKIWFFRYNPALNPILTMQMAVIESY